jgi:hypothetical protein
MGTKTIKTIKIAEDFTKFPAGRFFSDGKFSGERFREEFLIPALENNDKVVVFIDGVIGYGSSFLEECFGGLIRKKRFTIGDLKKRLEIKFDDPSFSLYETEIWEYINDAE